MTETAIEAVDLDLTTGDPRPECDNPECTREAIWRATNLPCGCQCVMCGPCRQAEDKYDAENRHTLWYCRGCRALGTGYRWDRL